MEAINFLGLFGSITKSPAPVLESMNNDLFHVIPPSIDLKTPLGPSPQATPVAPTKISSVFSGLIIIL